MFWLFISDLALRTAQEDPFFRGFNRNTIYLLNLLEPLEGFFRVIKEERDKKTNG